MIYSHTVTVYAPDGTLQATIADAVELSAFGITGYPAGTVQGGPVEVAFTPDGTKAYVSNYEMYGPGFGHPGDDICDPVAGYDNSFVYRIDVKTLQVDQVIEVGPVPKYVAVSPNGKWLLVSNWCGYDLSVVDIATAKEVQRIPIGSYPRGIVIAPDSSPWAATSCAPSTSPRSRRARSSACPTRGTSCSAPMAARSTPRSTRQARWRPSTPRRATSSPRCTPARRRARWRSRPTARRSTS
jgi:YVTN family beta-propeller protein